MVNHARVALYFPVPYEGTVKRADKDMPVVQVAILADVGPIFVRHGEWVVTPKGIECLQNIYVVEKSRLGEQDWERHMSEKTWVVQSDFQRALDDARTLLELGVI